ncbi:MAG: hypothetical protein FRX48_04460 [Lasallia pustulata]|uniref:PH domain-like protein n=1 Tax=Lasallia pustulata TaxID=136370 RepID=A0A5M8PTJ7_9LECA|nr:MAG: hypothetical protein FRX48_04460 [Lasallia pustulata]
MTPRKIKQRYSQSHLSLQSHQPSGYESDVDYVSDAPPPPPTRTNAELNLSVLRRHDLAIASILSIAPYAVVYLFSPPSQQWEKSGIEGTLFVCQLSPSKLGVERYSVLVLNRRGLDNFRVELVDGSDVDITEDYVILQSNDNDRNPQVYGLWIFSEPPPSSTANSRAINAQIIRECAIQAETTRKMAEQNVQADGQLGEEFEIVESEPMGRQLSLKELLGQQRKEDDGWSVRSHSPQTKQPQFIPSADTDFFRTARRQVQPQQQQRPPAIDPVQPSSHGRGLLDLFRTAGQGYKPGT